MQVTDELRVLVEAEVARAVENFKKLEGSVDRAEKKTESLGDALDSISKKSMILSTVIAGAGVAAIKLAGENEKLKLSLKNMLGSAEEASAVFEDWRRLGTSPGLSVDEVFTLGRAMVNMGHDTAYATQTIQMLGDVAAGTGSSFGAISGSFERVRAQKKLTTRDLSALQQQGIPILKQLAKELGTSEDGVRSLAAEGKLGFGDLEKAFKGMTSPGGQFAGMMDELSGTTLEKFSNAADGAKQALASFGELMLPIATELLDSASSILRGISDMDEGTKRFVIGMGGVVAVSGPAIMAINGISAAMAAVAANPYILVIGGAIAAAGALAGIIYKQANAYDDLQNKIKETDNAAKSLLTNFSQGNDEKVLDEKTTRELIKLYPELSGVISANTTTVREAFEAQRVLNEQKIIDTQSSRIESLKRDQQTLGQILREEAAANEFLRQAQAAGEQEWIEQARRNIALIVADREEWVRVIHERQRDINAVLAGIGKQWTLGGEIIDIPITVTVDAGNVDRPDKVITPQVKKRWQDWYGEIAKIDPARFGDSGARAAELYLAEFSRSFEAGKNVFDALDEEFNIAEVLRGQQAEIQMALVDLLSIDPADIDDQFTIIDRSISPLIDEYKRLGEAARDAAGQMEATKTIENLRKQIDDFGKSESQLAYETALANKATSEQAEEIKQLTDEYRRIEILAEYQQKIDEIGKSQNELALAAYAAAGATDEELIAFKEMLELLEKMQPPGKKLKSTLDGIIDSLVNLGATSALGVLEELGAALGQGKDAGDAMRNSLVAMSQEILNVLPNLFLQAGLQLIAQGQWALGLGFVAAAGSTALIKGYVDGSIEAEKTAAEMNAHGNVFDEYGKAARTFAAGGMFTNQIVSAPTYFRHGGGLGLMGEAGPEAIMPLARMPNGDLGIQTASGGTQVVVNIFNNSGAEVQQEEREDDSGGKQIDIIIGEVVNRHIASGKADRVMGGRYNLRAAGV